MISLIVYIVLGSILLSLVIHISYKQGWNKGWDKRDKMAKDEEKLFAKGFNIIQDISRPAPNNWQYDPELIRIGSEIHIHSMMGIYEVMSFTRGQSITITCRKWRTKPASLRIKTIPWQDFKCFKGSANPKESR